MKLRPIGTVIVLALVKKDEISKSGFYVPSMDDSLNIYTADEWGMKSGKIIAMGEEVTQFKLGEEVIVKHNSMVPVQNKIEAVVRGIIYESDILVVVEK